jgi:cAMP phosphodiesterase
LHPLSGVANLLRRKHAVDVLPLFSFGDADPDDAEDERELERLWQDPARLAESCAAAAAAIESVPRLQELATGFPDLVPRLRDLETIARWAAGRDAKVRITYRL